MYVKPKEAKRRLGVSDRTLRTWGECGKISYIRVDGGNRLYDIAEFINSHTKSSSEDTQKKKYIYCRVSSSKQKEDLERQVNYLKERYPAHEVVKEIASGINFKRKGLNKILADAMQGCVEEVVVANRDRLCRIAWQHFSWLFKYHGVRVVVQDTSAYSPESELSDDLLSIIHVFSSRHYGMRRKYTAGGDEENKTENAPVKRKQASRSLSQETA